MDLNANKRRHLLIEPTNFWRKFIETRNKKFQWALFDITEKLRGRKLSPVLRVNFFRKDILFFSILPNTKQKISASVGLGKNLNFQVCFLKELKTQKIYFEIDWPLKVKTKSYKLLVEQKFKFSFKTFLASMYDY